MVLKVKEVAETFVAEVLGFDLGDDHNPTVMGEIKRLWWKYQILLFRNQNIDESEEARFSSKLGPLEIHLRHHS